MTTTFVKALAASALLALPVSAADWPQLRGPHFNGSSTETALPTQFSKTQNIAWAVAMPGPSAATPIIHGDHVFVSSADPKTGELLAMALDRKTGKRLWEHTVSLGLKQDDKSNFASPSPATDGKLVVFFYGNGELAAFNFSGKKLWSRNLQKEYGPFAFNWTFSTSPLLYEGKLYMQVLQRDVPVNGRGLADRENESYLLALNPETGKTLWRVVRPSEAVAESREAFTTPIPFESKGRKELLVVGGDCLTGHDPATGKELWRWGTWNPTKIGHWRLVPSPVAGGGVILACAPKRDPIYAIKAGGSGTLTDSAIAWTSKSTREVTSDVPTPAFSDGDFFVLSDVAKSLSRVDPKTGSTKWMVATPNRPKYEASPTVADGKVFLMNFAGDVVIADAAKGTILNTIAMGEPGDDTTRSSISVAHGQLFIRTNAKLYCVGKK
ncbi:MAG: PQQ-binding-like beta-propeller repeat protein [Verrucomicrobiota bacterium]